MAGQPYKPKRGMDPRALMNDDGESFPLFFAKQICVDSGLWDSLDEKDPRKKYTEYQQLKNFQQMSISCKFDECMVAYYGTDITEEQLQGLMIIHKATKSWIKGELVGVLMSKLSKNKITNKDLASSVAVIIDSLMNDGEDGDKIDKSTAKKLIVHFANPDAKNKLNAISNN